MTGFISTLVTEQIGHQAWAISRPIKFVSETGFQVKVPAGFKTDLASIPAIAQGIISKVGYWSPGAVIHDFLYFQHRAGLEKRITRETADNALLEACKISAAAFNVPTLQRRDWLIYGGVRAGGLSSWETPDERAKRNILNGHITDE